MHVCFNLAVSSEFIEVGDTFNADRTDEYFAGEVEYICIGPATVSRGALDDCVR